MLPHTAHKAGVKASLTKKAIKASEDRDGKREESWLENPGTTHQFVAYMYGSILLCLKADNYWYCTVNNADAQEQDLKEGKL